MMGLALAAGLLAAGCDDSPAGLVCDPPADGERRVPLVAVDGWTVASTADDPFAEFRPGEDISCPPTAREVEDLGGTNTYSVETGDCPYTTVQQPLLANVCEGDELYVWMWNFRLTAPEDATAHLAVAIDGEIVWSRDFPIPSDSGLTTETVPFPHAFLAGAQVTFHVRNHGDNSYNLIQLSAVRGGVLPEVD